MKLIVLVLVAGLLLTGCAMESDSQSARDRTDDGQTRVDKFLEENEKEEEAPPPEPDPDATFTKTCDYLLADDIGGSHTFIGTSRVKNTGNIGVDATVTFKWFQAGAEPVTVEKDVSLRVGQRKTVNVNLPADDNNIDRLQALPYGQQCQVKAKLTDTFGEPVEN